MDPHPLTDPRLDEIPVEECGEPLVDVRDIPSLAVDERLGECDGASTRLRSTVVDRLVIAQSLLSRGLRLLVIEGHRTPRRQREHFAQSVAVLAALHPDWPAERVEQVAGWHCSPSGTAPHLTGAAVDVTLCDRYGEELDLGGPVQAPPPSTVDVSVEACANRRMLGAAMTGAAFINLPTAWWHWSFGDPYWALITGARAAIYGAVDGAIDS